MTVDRGPSASLFKGAKRPVAGHVEQMVVVRDHLVFGMHLDPFSRGLNEDLDANWCAGASGPSRRTQASS
jgi:hypothetical protein